MFRDYGQADHTISMLRGSRRGPSAQDQAANACWGRFRVALGWLCCGQTNPYGEEAVLREALEHFLCMLAVTGLEISSV